MLYKYISDLLYRYECVIIPEFGGLLTKTISTKIDKETNTFFPPTKQLGFNSQLVENDGLLANHIASVDKVPYETAVNFIKFEVSELKKKLESQDVRLDNIGVFALNTEGKIIFEPDSDSNFLTDTFGLSSIVAPNVSREDYLEEEVVFGSISDVVSAEEIAVNHETLKRGISPFFKYAATLALLVTLIAVFSKQILKNNKLGETIAELEADQNTKINQRIQEATFEISNKLPDITIKVKNEQEIVANTEALLENNEEYNDENLSDNTNADENSREIIVLKQDRIDQALVNQADKETENSETTLEKNSKPTNSTIDPQVSDDNTLVANKARETVSNTLTKRYHIIAGAFREPANADKKVRQLKAKGYAAQKVGINKWQLTQVAFSSYTTKQEAQKALNKIRNTEAKDAWMLIK